MSMRADYILEREGRGTIEHEFGYLEYLFQDKEKFLYITDLYVVPDKRKSGVAKELANKAVEIAKKEKFIGLVGSVCLDTKDCDASMKVLLAYGMKPYAMEPARMMIYFKKMIEEG